LKALHCSLHVQILFDFVEMLSQDDRSNQLCKSFDLSPFQEEAADMEIEDELKEMNVFSSVPCGETSLDRSSAHIANTSKTTGKKNSSLSGKPPPGPPRKFTGPLPLDVHNEAGAVVPRDLSDIELENDSLSI
jgi:hypothetical protein